MSDVSPGEILFSEVPESPTGTFLSGYRYQSRSALSMFVQEVRPGEAWCETLDVELVEFFEG